MAVSVQQGVQQCQHLTNTALSQVLQEDQADPLSSVQLQHLHELLGAVRNVSRALEEEDKIFEDDAELGYIETNKLNTIVSDIREASRKLSIVLAAGCNQFRGQRADDASMLESLGEYIHPRIKADLKMQQLVPILRKGRAPSTPYSPYAQQGSPYYVQQGWGYARNGPLVHVHGGQTESAHEMVSFSENFTPGESAATTMKKLVAHFSELAEHFSKFQLEREEAFEQQAVKAEVLSVLVTEVASLVPKIRTHVLRIGIGRGQGLNISQGCGNVQTITSLFQYAEVEDVHRQLEETRDRITQELTLRKLQAKMR